MLLSSCAYHFFISHPNRLSHCSLVFYYWRDLYFELCYVLTCCVFRIAIYLYVQRSNMLSFVSQRSNMLSICVLTCCVFSFSLCSDGEALLAEEGPRAYIVIHTYNHMYVYIYIYIYIYRYTHIHVYIYTCIHV